MEVKIARDDEAAPALHTCLTIRIRIRSVLKKYQPSIGSDRVRRAGGSRSSDPRAASGALAS